MQCNDNLNVRIYACVVSKTIQKHNIFCLPEGRPRVNEVNRNVVIQICGNTPDHTSLISGNMVLCMC